ncbi:winged helix-turn-helix domain-containing protein [Salmonella enterica]|uniref:winged helix-turn-helix domain-containing protein n=1 Tax=Salmonella enterica TaxID=28901 RepID=UPI001482F499|nr:winged helix-turn-helix domain-containing protein [Salmonella enterica]
MEERQFQISRNEMLILEYLYNNAGKTVSREDLLSKCWPDRIVSPVSLPVAIKHIRDIFKQITDCEVIITHKSIGYSFCNENINITIKEEYPPSSNATDYDKNSPKTSKRIATFINKYRGWYGDILIYALVLLLLKALLGDDNIVTITNKETQHKLITNASISIEKVNDLFSNHDDIIFFDDASGLIKCNDKGCRQQ